MCSTRASGERFPLRAGSFRVRHRSPDESPCQSMETGASDHSGAPGVREVRLLVSLWQLPQRIGPTPWLSAPRTTCGMCILRLSS